MLDCGTWQGMNNNSRDGVCCTICGGIPPDQIRIRKIPIGEKETGIDRPDWILHDVARLNLSDDTAITNELVRRVRQFNDIPTRKMKEYREALLREFRMFDPSQGSPEPGE